MEKFLMANGGVLLADDMGLGKTLQALLTLERKRPGQMFPALVVCPASVKYSWEHQALEHVNVRAQVIEGTYKQSYGTMGYVPQLMIINPDILTSWLPWFMSINLRTLVLDECQYYTNLKTKRTDAAIALSRNVPYKIAMSGTPLTNRPSELWPTLHMLRPDLFQGFFIYAQKFCKPKKEYGKWTYKGATNLPELHALLKETCMIRRLKSDVEKDLPKKIRQVISMDLSDRKEYEYASANFSGWLKKNYGKKKAAKSLKAEAVTRIGYLLRLAARLKARAVVDWVNRFLEEYPDEKLVLFAIHVKMIALLQRRIKAKHVTVDGSVIGRKRKLAIDQFRKDPKTRVFIGNIKAAGTGVDGLQDVCNNLAFCELWWRPGDYIQAEDRLHRIGSVGVSLWLNYLVAGDTIEEHLAEILQEKQKVIRQVLDGQVQEGDMDILDKLIEIMKDTK